MNNDLEQAALIAQVDVMSQTHRVANTTQESLTDNTPAISRMRKGANGAPGLAASLCQVAGDHQWEHRYYPVMGFIPGVANRMADDASRLQHLSPASFHTHLMQAYPQPLPWLEAAPRPELLSQLTSALHCKPPAPPPCPAPAGHSSMCGPTGLPSAPPLAMTLACAAAGRARRG